MIWLVGFGVICLLCFSLVLLVGAPYLPTLEPQLATALGLSGLKPGQTLLELGCGDGKVLRAAAQQGLHAVGYELNPLLYLVARLRTWRYRRNVRVIWGDFWRVDWPGADAIFVFLLPRYMLKLDKKVASYCHRPVRLVSIAFEIPGKRSDSSADGVFCYQYR